MAFLPAAEQRAAVWRPVAVRHLMEGAGASIPGGLTHMPAIGFRQPSISFSTKPLSIILPAFAATRLHANSLSGQLIIVSGDLIGKSRLDHLLAITEILEHHSCRGSGWAIIALRTDRAEL